MVQFVKCVKEGREREGAVLWRLGELKSSEESNKWERKSKDRREDETTGQLSHAGL